MSGVCLYITMILVFLIKKYTKNYRKLFNLNKCERTGKELPGSVVLITRFTRVTPWMYAYV